MNLGWKTWNDRLSLLLLLGIPALWVIDHWAGIRPEALGATIPVWTLVAQYYFRKKEAP
ncbi:MAG TPA: hypothetical protein VI855_07415 [Dehalococcoidia bacterium]|nr:hypothetical protein [Dehalococcoidia bacterium]